MNGLVQDLRYAARSLVKNPGFGAVGVVLARWSVDLLVALAVTGGYVPDACSRAGPAGRLRPRYAQLSPSPSVRLLNSTAVSFEDIDHVFLTGGSSFVPAVRQIFIERFGLPKITGGEELTSVATGLALRAAEQWPA